MASLTAQCDCGAVQITLPHLPRRITACPCDFCRKTGVRWAYFPKDSIAVSGPTDTYQRGEKRLDFHRCATCGITTHWWPERVDWANAGVNMAHFDPALLADIPVGPPE